MTRKTPEPPLHIDLPFDEALRRFAQTKPEEVASPVGRKRKIGKPPKPGAVLGEGDES